MPSLLSGWPPTACDHTAPRSGTLGSNAGTSAGDGRTTELRIRIRRHGGGSARCSGSRARFSPEISFHTRRRLQHLQRPTPPRLRPHAPRASRCRDDHVADRSRSGLTIPEAPTLRAPGSGNVTTPLALFVFRRGKVTP